MRHLTEEELILFHYDESEDPRRIAGHLAACVPCRKNYQTLRSTLGTVTSTPVPERDPDYGTRVWDRLKSRLEPRPARSTWRRLAKAFRFAFPSPETTAGLAVLVRPWSIGAGVLLLAGAAFIGGLLWQRPSPRENLRQATTSPHDVRGAGPPVPLRALGDHLERSQLALIELINSKTNGPVDISMEQVLARELVDVNRLFCRVGASLGDDLMMSTLEDLERTLLDISNSPSRLSTEQFGDLKRRLGPDAVLCAIKVVGAQIRAREKLAGAGRHAS
jgi:hypothetical protein